MDARPHLIAVMGPTGIGKSDLAERLASSLDAILVNADAFMVYRGFDIGTNKPEDREKYELIDIRDPDGAARTIRAAIATNAWQQRRDAIEAARQRVLEHHHLFAVIARIVAAAARTGAGYTPATTTILSRHAWRKAHPLGSGLHMLEKAYVRIRALWHAHHGDGTTDAQGTRR